MPSQFPDTVIQAIRADIVAALASGPLLPADLSLRIRQDGASLSVQSVGNICRGLVRERRLVRLGDGRWAVPGTVPSDDVVRSSGDVLRERILAVLASDGRPRATLEFCAEIPLCRQQLRTWLQLMVREGTLQVLGVRERTRYALPDYVPPPPAPPAPPLRARRSKSASQPKVSKAPVARSTWVPVERRVVITLEPAWWVGKDRETLNDLAKQLAPAMSASRAGRSIDGDVRF